MNNKKVLDVKSVHKFTENAHMKFRPTHFELPLVQPPPSQGVVSKFSSIFTNFISNRFTPQKNAAPTDSSSNSRLYSKSAIIESQPDNKNRSYIEPRSAVSKIEEPSGSPSPSRVKFAAKMEEIDALKMEKEAQAIF